MWPSSPRPENTKRYSLIRGGILLVVCSCLNCTQYLLLRCVEDWKGGEFQCLKGFLHRFEIFFYTFQTFEIGITTVLIRNNDGKSIGCPPPVDRLV